ncbi:MAG TPA: DNA cytosine methyltransferase [Actinomycetota bacterium]|nr:DNA cytosine methyltransferase [Actinomycetota bacterium]
MGMLTSLEICTGAGGQALGLEQAAFHHLALVEIEEPACRTLKLNRPEWPVVRADVRDFHARGLRGQVDLLAAGVPCPPFSVAGKQLGADDERDLFPEVIRLAKETNPRAVFVENVPGLLESRFDGYRTQVLEQLDSLGYEGEWRKFNASDFEVPQLRPRALLVAAKRPTWKRFTWPEPSKKQPLTVGQALLGEMKRNGWLGAEEWAAGANSVAPTLVGGSKKHGGPDLGPSRARARWAELGVNGKVLAQEPPEQNFVGLPHLTVKMAALLQGFPQDWVFFGPKTVAYRQVGNAFPPPVAKAIGIALAKALTTQASEDRVEYGQLIELPRPKTHSLPDEDTAARDVR